MSETFAVDLHGVRVGTLLRAADGVISFVLDDDYAGQPHRLVLGQQFEDRPHTSVFRKSAYPGRLPTFFANLLPEGAFRESIVGVDSGADDLSILGLLGSDLPGAVTVRSSESLPTLTAGTSVFEEPHENGRGIHDGLRFSLAGVQIKFSAVRDSEQRLAVPAKGIDGQWILKLGSPSYPRLVENELLTMRWASRCGIGVPIVDAVAASSIAGLDARVTSLGTEVFVIERYDRAGDRRIHQEDLAQVRGVPPELKYERWSYEGIAHFVGDLCGPEDLEEFVRRLVFMVLSGNTDAHLKNWSLVYPDGRMARLSPAYDLVFVRQYLGADFLALPIANERDPTKITFEHFRRVQRHLRKVGLDIPLEDQAKAFVLRCLDEWEACRPEAFVEYRQALDRYLGSLPLTRP